MIEERLRKEIRSLLVIRAEALKLLPFVTSQPASAKKLHKQADKLRLAIAQADREIRKLDEQRA